VLENGQEFAGAQGKRRGDVVRAGVPMFGDDGSIVGAVIVDTAIPRDVSKAARRTGRSSDEFRQLRVLKQPIRNGYTLTFFLIMLVALFSATWFGFYFAKGISVPIERLGEGMHQVAQGNWKYRAHADGDEEVLTLVNTFNDMTSDLESIHSALEERRRYIENILANISAGVVSVDRDGEIATVNPVACTMLGLQPEQVRGQKWREVFARPELKTIADLVGRLGEEGREKVEQQMKLAAGVRPLTAWVTATKLIDDSGEPRGFILFFEDVTQLLRVERMEAWREVARRIAHEIKNPLTPIQLSAQRLRKRYGTTLPEDDRALFDECTRTIVGQVDQLKRLVNEFSTFARLPAVEVAPNDLNGLVEEALVLFREAHPNVHFTRVADPDLPLVEIDRDAVKRAIINLLDNAVAACQGAPEPGQVEVVTAQDVPMGVLRLEVADNGCGMTSDVKARAFEPYYSTKKDGTGLGLAIVSAIVADHHAYVRIRDNPPRGTRLVIEFPLRRSMSLRAAARA
jgi:two-component system nitrogen regulation sensor histidine kinase NtrY